MRGRGRGEEGTVGDGILRVEVRVVADYKSKEKRGEVKKRRAKREERESKGQLGFPSRRAGEGRGGEAL